MQIKLGDLHNILPKASFEKGQVYLRATLVFIFAGKIDSGPECG